MRDDSERRICPQCGILMASADDVCERRAKYANSPGGHADRHTLVLEAAERAVDGER